jgi:hypothetical protein
MPFELINADGTTTALHREPRTVDGFNIPLPEEIDASRSMAALALVHARVFKTLLGLHRTSTPSLAPTPAVVEAYEEILHDLIARRVPIAINGVAAPWTQPLNARSVTAWHKKAMGSLIGGPRRNKWPDLTHRLVLAYCRAGYMDPNRSRLKTSTSLTYANDIPLYLAFEANSHMAAAALIELGANFDGYPTKDWVVSTSHVKDVEVKGGDLGAHLDAHCPRGDPARAAIDKALMERAISEHKAKPQARVDLVPASVASPVALSVCAATPSAPMRRRAL